MNRAVLVACLALPACDVGARTGVDPAGVVDPDGVPRSELVEVFRLGGPEAPEPELFTGAPALVVAPDGSLFALERSANEVRRFAPDGTFLGTVGREGEGPGEFENAYLLGLVGDTLWVRNMSPPNVSFFTTGGDLLRTERYPDPVIGRTGVPEGPEAMLLGGGSFMVGAVPWGGPQGPVEVPLLIVGAGGASRDTLAAREDPSGVWVPGVGILWRIRPEPLPPLHAVVPGGRGVLVAEWRLAGVPEGAVVLRRHRPDASLERIDTIRFMPVPVAPRLADSIVAAAADSVRALVARVRASGLRDPPEPPDDLAGTLREALDLGASLAPIRALLAGLDGTVWVQAVRGPATTTWVALSREGRPLVRVDLPDGATLRAASRQAVWTTETDALEVPYVARYDLTEGPSGGR